jgi:CheY-like chemotaxis protein
MGGGAVAVVLLVEDDPDHAELVARALAELDDPVRLVHVSDGSSALAYLVREAPWTEPESSPRPDLVLLDLRLPGTSGAEVLRRIKAEPRLHGIPVIVLSTSEVRGDLGAAEGEQADGCAVKPIDGERFRVLVQELVSSWTGRGLAGG